MGNTGLSQPCAKGLRSDFTRALSYDAKTAQDRIDGTANIDVSLIKKAATEFDRADTKIEVTTADVKAATNQ